MEQDKEKKACCVRRVLKYTFLFHFEFQLGLH